MILIILYQTYLKIKKIEKFLNCSKSKFTQSFISREMSRKVNNFKKTPIELNLLNELNQFKKI